jgi:hypothetical protein
MPLTSYTSGEVLTASSLNANFTFAAANPVGGLTLISATTIGTTVASVTVSSAFSATYDAYKIVISGGVGTGSPQLILTFGATTTGYNYGYIFQSYNATITGAGATNAAGLSLFGTANASGISFNNDVVNPFLAKETMVASQIWYDGTNIGSSRGVLANTTSYTAFTITTTTGTLTGGTIRVYGYLNS